jgi:hypothetical protein
MPYPDATRCLEVFNQVERLIESRYGVPVRIGDVCDPFTGDLDGCEIQIDHDIEPEEGLFILVHLFGHTVQWNLSERGRTLGVQQPDSSISEMRLDELYHYEREAAELSLTLFHEAGVFDLDDWVADFFHCDWAYLAHFYRTGEKLPFRSFWKTGTDQLTPVPIPAFTPTRWRTRADGIVL